MILILSGGIGSGKSVAAGMLNEMYGFPVYSADQRVKELYIEHPTLLSGIEKELFEYFCKLDGFKPKKGNSLSGFAPDWIGQFYARSQWQENIPSTKLVSILPPDFVKASYAGLHDLDLDLAVNKVFKNIHV